MADADAVLSKLTMGSEEPANVCKQNSSASHY